MTTKCEQPTQSQQSPPTPEEVARLLKSAESFAKYHAENATYGGHGREFHVRAETFIRDVAAQAERVPGLVADLAERTRERDSALDLLRSARATLKHLGASHAISEHAYQELDCHLTDEPHDEDGQPITTAVEADRDEVQGLAETYAYEADTLEKLTWALTAAGVDRAEHAESERDAARNDAASATVLQEDAEKECKALRRRVATLEDERNRAEQANESLGRRADTAEARVRELEGALRSAADGVARLSGYTKKATPIAQVLRAALASHPAPSTGAVGRFSAADEGPRPDPDDHWCKGECGDLEFDAPGGHEAWHREHTGWAGLPAPTPPQSPTPPPGLLEAVGKVQQKCPECYGRRVRETACTMCHDSTWDHECDSKEVPCSWEGHALLDSLASHPAPATGAVDREHLGQEVRAEWVAWAKEQPGPKASWLVPWEGLGEPDKEVDRRIGERLFRLGASASTPPRGLLEAVGPLMPALRGMAADGRPDSAATNLHNDYRFDATFGQVRAFVAACDAAKGGEAREEGDMAGLMDLCSKPTTDTLLRVETEGGQVYVVDGSELRALHEDAAKYRAAVGRLRLQIAELDAASPGSARDAIRYALLWVMDGGVQPSAPRATLDKARVVEVLERHLTGLRGASYSGAVNSVLTSCARDLGLTLATPPSGPGGGKCDTCHGSGRGDCLGTEVECGRCQGTGEDCLEDDETTRPEGGGEDCTAHPEKRCDPESPGVFECRVTESSGRLLAAQPIATRARIAPTPVPTVPPLKVDTAARHPVVLMERDGVKVSQHPDAQSGDYMVSYPQGMGAGRALGVLANEVVRHQGLLDVVARATSQAVLHAAQLGAESFQAQAGQALLERRDQMGGRTDERGRRRGLEEAARIVRALPLLGKAVRRG